MFISNSNGGWLLVSSARCYNNEECPWYLLSLLSNILVEEHMIMLIVGEFMIPKVQKKVGES